MIKIRKIFDFIGWWYRRQHQDIFLILTFILVNTIFPMIIFYPHTGLTLIALAVSFIFISCILIHIVHNNWRIFNEENK